MAGPGFGSVNLSLIFIDRILSNRSQTPQYSQIAFPLVPDALFQSPNYFWRFSGSIPTISW